MTTCLIILGPLSEAGTYSGWEHRVRLISWLYDRGQVPPHFSNPSLLIYKAEKIGHMCKLETGGLKKTCLNLGSGNLDFWRVPIISRAGNEWFPVPGLCTNNGVYTEHLLCGSQDWVPAHQGVPMWPAPQGPPGHWVTRTPVDSSYVLPGGAECVQCDSTGGLGAGPWPPGPAPPLFPFLVLLCILSS